MRLMRTLNILYNLCVCEYVHYSCLLPLFRSVTASIAVLGVSLYAGYSCVAVVSVFSLAIAVPIRYYVLNTWCVTPCGELPITSRHLSIVRDQRDLVRGGTFGVDCPSGT